ncbi:hypothetical protein SAMN05421743_11221 [Thalassobacillus cyri]|uniref:Uncharacterized protein n=1 Tax=Thalassobacillus cyri TaxID=571932 RepID=A0A1H4FN07_9BACI|nr:hypothetical protein [Thalassobacillus cyri]SEA98684.1 hypothetical protein SAMN05421743_11221 [Thalassobacillus cyri]
MLVNVSWINFHKESELDRPELFRRMDEIEWDTNAEDAEINERNLKKKLSESFKLPVKKIQIIDYDIKHEVKS